MNEPTKEEIKRAIEILRIGTLSSPMSHMQGGHAKEIVLNHVESLQSRITELEAEVIAKDEALQEVWGRGEMGWILDAGVSRECGECGAQIHTGTTMDMQHKEGCIQGVIHKALSPTAPNATLERLKGMREALEACKDIIHAECVSDPQYEEGLHSKACIQLNKALAQGGAK